LSEELEHFVVGEFSKGLSKLRRKDVWKDGQSELNGPFDIRFPRAQGWGEQLLLASLLKRHAVNLNASIEVHCAPAVCSILSGDPAFNAFALNQGEDRPSNVRSPLAILEAALSGGLLDQPFQALESLPTHPQSSAVGVAWASVRDGARGSSEIPHKNVPLRSFLDIFNEAEADVVSFQRRIGVGTCRDDADRLKKRFGVRCRVLLDDILDADNQKAVVQEILNLRCMVTVSTTTAHIAAVLGVPTVLIAAKHKSKQWFWRAQVEQGKCFYPSVKVIIGGPDDGEEEWWKRCIEPAKQALADTLSR